MELNNKTIMPSWKIIKKLLKNNPFVIFLYNFKHKPFYYFLIEIYSLKIPAIKTLMNKNAIKNDNVPNAENKFLLLYPTFCI